MSKAAFLHPLSAVRISTFCLASIHTTTSTMVEAHPPVATPDESEILEAIRSLYAVHPRPGIKRLVSSIKSSYPDWAPHIRGESVRIAVRKLDEELGHSIHSTTSASEPSAEGECLTERTTAPATVAAECLDSDPKPNDQAKESNLSAQKKHKKKKKKSASETRFLQANIDECRHFMSTHRWPRYAPVMSALLLNSIAQDYKCLPLINVPAVCDRHNHSAFEEVYRLFYAEWDCSIGPDPDEPMAPAEPLNGDMEALQFITLFPSGTGHYRGPAVHGMPFEEYVMHLLRLPRSPFQRHATWLQWALTRTEDRGLAKVLNCCLLLLHGFKARHLGRGKVQGWPLETGFKRLQLVNGALE